MKNMIRYNNQEFLIELKNATVIHSDKYAETNGGWGSFPVRSTLYTDVVFDCSDDGKRVPVTIANRNLPVYKGQLVTMILLEQTVIGFVDRSTSKYYYTRTDFNKILHRGIPALYFWASGVSFLTLFFLMILFRKDDAGDYLWIPFSGIASTILIYHIQKAWINYRITRLIDQYLREP